jgi:CheY-like chemotaxis protein
LSLPHEPPRTIDVLLVEDDPGDTLMIREAFEHHSIPHELHHVPDGVEAMAFLHGEGKHAGSPRPDLILLDLNLPRMDGRQVLKEVKTNPDLSAIPIVVLTTSEADEDILRSYELHANAYVTKPVDFDQFIEAVRMTDDFFLNIVKLPRHRS